MKLGIFVLFVSLCCCFSAFGACPPPPNLDEWLNDHPGYSALVLWDFFKQDLEKNAGPTTPPANIRQSSIAIPLGTAKPASVWSVVQTQNASQFPRAALPRFNNHPLLLNSGTLDPINTLAWPQWPKFYQSQVRKYFADYWQWNCQAWELIEQNQKPSTGLLGQGKQIADPELVLFFNTLQDPDPNFSAYPPPLLNIPNFTGDLISMQDAFALYAKNLAWRLVLETSGKLTWSMGDLDGKGLQQLLDGRGLFRATAEVESISGEKIPVYGYKPNPSALIGPPLVTFSFLVRNDILMKNRHDTVAGLLDWEDHLFHAGLGNLKTEYSAWYIYYQYEGPPPLSKILNGSVQTTETEADEEAKNWTLGCSVTASFNQLVLATVNIPAEIMAIPGDTHRSNCFPTEQLCTCHADDPYPRRIFPDVPAQDLLIPKDQFSLYFQDDKKPPVSLQFCWAKAKLKNLPKVLLKEYCEDGKTPHGDGKVFEHFKGFYTVQGLEVYGLWLKLEQKVQALGGCEASWKYF